MYIHKCITLSIVHDQLLVFNLQQIKATMDAHQDSVQDHCKPFTLRYFFGDGRATVEVR